MNIFSFGALGLLVNLDSCVLLVSWLSQLTVFRLVDLVLFNCNLVGKGFVVLIC